MFAVANEHHANENIGIEVRDHSLSMQGHFQKKVTFLTVWARKRLFYKEMFNYAHFNEKEKC